MISCEFPWAGSQNWSCYPIIYLAVKVADPTKLEIPGKVDKILAAARTVPSELGIEPADHAPRNNFQQLPPYVKESQPSEASDSG